MPEHAFLDDLPAYALGALGPDDARRLEEHLRGGCSACEPELASLQTVVARLPYSLAGTDVPPGLRAKVMGRLEAAPAPASRVVRFRFREVLPLAAALLLAASLGFLWHSASGEAQALLTENSRLRTTLAEEEKELLWLKDPRVQMALLKGLEGSPNAKAKLLWHPRTAQGILYVEGLPPLPLTKSYELWVFVKETPLPAGTFDVGQGGTAVPLSKLNGAPDHPVRFAVSVEPRGGGPTPTGAIVLVGDVL